MSSSKMTRLLLVFGLPALLTVAFGSSVRAQNGWGLGIVDGEFHFTDLTRGRVVKIDRSGRLNVLFENIHCHNLAPGYDGRIYGESVGSNSGGDGGVVGVWSLTADGEKGWVMPPTGQSLSGVWIARDEIGNSYAWEGELDITSRIVRRGPSGEISILGGSEWGQADGVGASARFGNIGGLASTRDGVVYVTDSGHLRRVQHDGTVDTVAQNIVSERTGGLPGQASLFNHSVGVAVSGDETVYIADHYNLRVMRWDRNNGASIVWNGADWLSRLTSNGIGWYPGGVAVDGADLYVLEVLIAPPLVADLVGSPRIRKILPDGSSTSVASVASTPMRAGAGGVGVLLILGVALLVRRLRGKRRASG